MKKTIIAIGCVVLTSVIAVSCKKDKDSGSSKSRMELLTSHAWIGTDLKLNGTSVWNDLVDDCDKDDFQTFKSDGTGVIDAGAEKCDTSDDQTTNFAWKFLNNETTLVYDGDTGTIAELSDTKLRLTMESAFGTAEVIMSKK